MPSSIITPSPSVAVVILNWNGLTLLKQFLPSVMATTYANATIYLADNGSTDESVIFVRENYPTIKVIENGYNFGFAKGYNQALQKIKRPYDYFVLLNSDVEVTPNWIEPVITTLESDPLIAACQPKIKAYYQKTHFEYAGAAGGYIDSLGYTFCRGRCFDVCEEDKGQYDDTREIFWGVGAALFVKANIYHQLGGLDDEFFAHMEEVDFCWRLKRAGYKVMYCPNSVVYHLGGGSLPKSNPKKTYLNFRNSLFMLYKNFTRTQLLTLFPLRLLLDVLAAVKLLASGNIKESIAIVRALGYFLTGIHKGVRRRKAAKQFIAAHGLPNAQFKAVGKYHGSIIIDYYIRGKRHFYEIVQKN